MPTIPSPRDGHYGSRSSLSTTPRTPGKNWSTRQLQDHPSHPSPIYLSLCPPPFLIYFTASSMSPTSFFLHYDRQLIFTLFFINSSWSSSVIIVNHHQWSSYSSQSFVGPSTRRLTTTVTDREVYAPQPRADLCVSTSCCSSLLLFDSYSPMKLKKSV